MRWQRCDELFVRPPARACVHLSTVIPYLSRALVLCETCGRGIGCLYDLIPYLAEFCNSSADFVECPRHCTVYICVCLLLFLCFLLIQSL